MDGPRPGAGPARAGALRWLAPLVVAAGGLVQLNALHGPFVFDDLPAIVDNPFLEHLWPLSRALDAPPGTGASGRPLVALSLALNHALGGRAPFGYHLFNVLAHVAASLALYGLVRRTLERYGRAPRLDPRLCAASVALLWSVHPLHTAALHHVIYRNEVLASLFVLLCLYAAARGWSAISVLACFLAMASKEMAAATPLLVLLWDRTFAAGDVRTALRERKSLYAGLVASWLLLAWLVATGERGASVGLGLEGIAPLDYLRTQAGALVHYLRLAVWPSPLVFDYGDWPVVRSLGAAAPAGLLVLVLLAASLLGAARRSAAGFAGSAAFLLLAPSSSVVPLSGALVAEHRVYLALAAPVAIVVVGTARWLGAHAAPAAAARALALGTLVLAGALGTRTVLRNRDYASRAALWSDTVAKRPDNARAWNGLGVALAAEGRLDEARAAYERTVALDPTHAKAQVNLANLLIAGRDPAAALPHYERAVELEPDSAEARAALGTALVALGRAERGVPELRRALALGPPPAQRLVAQQMLAWALATSPDDALRDGDEALRLARELEAATGGRDARVLDALAAAQAELGRFDEAERTARRALEAGELPRPLRARIEAHLHAYEARRPWREGAR